MYFKQFYLGCLAHASYLIGSDGEAVVVDPQRDVDQYIKEAEAQQLKIRYVIETHLHADFVSGHRELAARTGATIVFGEKARASFPHLAVRDGDSVTLGQIQLRVIETPGHTPEGICILIDDPLLLDAPMKLLTGDTLFVGDVGRPDLAGSKGFSASQMAEMLSETIQHKLMPLGDSVEIYPAHGAGSMCGRSISKETFSTMGAEKDTNYALQAMTRESFVKMMTTDLPEAPAYFSTDAEINRSGAPPLYGASRPAALRAEEVELLNEAQAVILDVRDGAAFSNGHIPGAINIGLSGQFASWAGSLLDRSRRVVLIANDLEEIDEAVMRLARVGLENIAGYLQGGLYAWDEAGLPVHQSSLISVGDLHQKLCEDLSLQILDVRRPAEKKAGMISGAEGAELASLSESCKEFSKTRPTVVVCQSGYRSSIAASVLLRAGFTDIYNLVGGMNAWNSFLMPPTEPTTACLNRI